MLRVAGVLDAYVFTVQEAVYSLLDVVPSAVVDLVLLLPFMQRFLFWLRLHLNIIVWVVLVTTDYPRAETPRVCLTEVRQWCACHVTVDSWYWQLHRDVDCGDVFLKCFLAWR